MSSLGGIPLSPLEDWLRNRYFSARIDISGSGVENYSLGQIRDLLGIEDGELDGIWFRDSPSHGGDRLRLAIGSRFGFDPAQVMVTHGSTEGIFLALASLLRPGDEVVVHQPAYQSLYSVAEAIGARVRVWELDENNDFHPDLDRLRPLLNERTKAVLVNFPHNPTGSSMAASELDEFLGLLAKYGTYLLWDGAFTELVYDREPLPDPAGTYDRVLSLGTLSKAYGAPGLRIGWCIAAQGHLDRMVEMRDYTSLNTSPVTEYLAARLLERADDVLAPRLVQARGNRDLLLRWSRDNVDLVDLPEPVGGVSAFPLLRGIPDVTRLSEDLFRARGVLVVPGQCFGHPARVRIGFGGPADELSLGLDELAEFGYARMSAPSSTEK